MIEFIELVSQKVLKGKDVTPEEVLDLSQVEGADLFFLLAAANRIRAYFLEDRVDLCSIINAKSGRCSEDCIYCAQSIHHQTGVKSFPLVSEKEILAAARRAIEVKAGRFGIVTSGRRVKGKEVQVIARVLKQMKEEEIPVSRCASLGSLSVQEALILKKAGLQRYHHNLETSPDFFPRICTTHTFEERMATVKTAKEAGLEVCSGGIFGLGEGLKDRIRLAFILKELDVDSVPLNFLHTIPGTPVEHLPSLPPLEILKTIALFRFILPTKDIKVCGGREQNLRSLQPFIFPAGANGMLIGDYLTTRGQDPRLDLEMIEDLGLKAI
ncbi:MAG: biotin synthase BioB [bacterium]|nr:biotin synthase BioB [bacterium]